MRFIAVGFLILLVCSAASAREIMTNDGRVIVAADEKLRDHRPIHRLNTAIQKRHRSSAAVKNSNENIHNGLIAEARRWLGATARQMGLHRVTLWCSAWLNWIVERTGGHGTGSDLAFSWRHWGRPAPGPAPGVIAVLRRRGGGHVGIVTQVLGHGKVRLISGNHGRRVREAVYSTRRVIAWRRP